MSIRTKITLDEGTLKADLEAIARVAGDGKRRHEVISAGVMALVQKRLLEKYVPRDKNGVTFWADVRNSAESDFSATEAAVSLHELGINLRYKGGTVTPGKSISSYTGKLTRALAIPSKDVPAEGGRQVRPGRAGLLAFIRATTRGGDIVGTLVEGMPQVITRGKRKGQVRIVPRPNARLMYTLKAVTRHRGDKKILPSQAEIREASIEAILDLLEAET